EERLRHPWAQRNATDQRERNFDLMRGLPSIGLFCRFINEAKLFLVAEGVALDERELRERQFLCFDFVLDLAERHIFDSTASHARELFQTGHQFVEEDLDANTAGMPAEDPPMVIGLSDR